LQEFRDWTHGIRKSAILAAPRRQHNDALDRDENQDERLQARPAPRHDVNCHFEHLNDDHAMNSQDAKDICRQEQAHHDSLEEKALVKGHGIIELGKAFWGITDEPAEPLRHTSMTSTSPLSSSVSSASVPAHTAEDGVPCHDARTDTITKRACLDQDVHEDDNDNDRDETLRDLALVAPPRTSLMATTTSHDAHQDVTTVDNQTCCTPPAAPVQVIALDESSKDDNGDDEDDDNHEEKEEENERKGQSQMKRGVAISRETWQELQVRAAQAPVKYMHAPLVLPTTLETVDPACH
jgi:hypothetical protein